MEQMEHYCIINELAGNNMMEQYKTQGTKGLCDFVSHCLQGYRVGYSDQFPKLRFVILPCKMQAQKNRPKAV
jgi:hypothetical protein